MSSDVLSEAKYNPYQTITENIVAAIEKGVGRFQLPWHTGVAPLAMPMNAATETPYRGINVLALWAEASVKGYITGYWASYRQWQNLGAQVRRNERGACVVFFKKIENETTGDEEHDLPRYVARVYRAFNSAQVDGWNVPLPQKISEVEINQKLDAFVVATKAQVRHGGLLARYRHDLDCIEIPESERFKGTESSSATESYYAVLLHELTHWSGAPHRLNRVFGKRFGDSAYAFEELVAELGSAFLCSAFSITNETRLDHATYVSSWLNILDRDAKAIFTAASLAQRAVEYLREVVDSPT